MPRARRSAFSKLDRAFYARDTVIVARDLLGALLVHRTPAHEYVGRIVETEAYLGERDQAAHARFGRTPRNRVLFGPLGHAYVYLIYGVHECINVVTGTEGSGAAVLIRAVEPVSGIEARTAGPGLLTKAMGLSRAHNGHDLLSDDLFLAPRPEPDSPPTSTTARIGVEYAGRWARRRLRFFVTGNPHVSRGGR